MATAKSDISQTLDFVSMQGDSFDLEIVVNNEDGTPYDFTGCTAEDIWKRHNTSILTFNTDSGLTLSSGKITYSKPDTVMGFQTGVYTHGFRITLPTGKVKTWFDGKATHQPQGSNNPGSQDVPTLTISSTGENVTLTVSEIAALSNADAGASDYDSLYWDHTTNKFKSKTLAEVKSILDLYVSVKDYGAKGDGATDDTVAIKAAITATPAGATLYFPKSANGYRITDTITLPATISCIMDAQVIYDGAAGKAAIVYGSASTIVQSMTFRLSVTRKTISSWSDETDIGIKLFNLNTCKGLIVAASNFTIGAQLIGSGKGASYNEISLGDFANNYIGLDLTNETSGWCNENLFLNGRFRSNVGTKSGSNRIGVRIHSRDGSYVNNNNNNFIKPSFELLQATANPGEALPVLITYGVQNLFRDCRNEANGTYFARIQNASSLNEFSIGYDSLATAIDDQSSTPLSYCKSRKTNIMRYPSLIFTSGQMHKTACFYDGATSYHIPNVGIAKYNQAAKVVLPSAASVTLNANYITFTASGGEPSVFIDTIKVKTFLIRKDCDTSYGGRLYVQCLDVDGNVLTDAGAGHPYIKSVSGNTFTYRADYGGGYRQGADSDEDMYITLHTDVKSIRIILIGVSGALRVRSFSVYANEGNAVSVWSGLDDTIPGHNIGTTSPTAGTWARGRVIYNAAPSAGGYAGWVCTVAGTPGTWKGFGLIES